MWWKVLLEIILEGLGVAKKAIPPDEIRVGRHIERQPLREQDLNQHMLNDDFGYLKRRPEIDVWEYMRDVHPKMSMAETVTHHKLLKARVIEYRKDVLKRRGFRWKKYRDWFESQAINI